MNVYPAEGSLVHARYLWTVERLVSRPWRLKQTTFLLSTTYLLCQRKIVNLPTHVNKSPEHFWSQTELLLVMELNFKFDALDCRRSRINILENIHQLLSA